MASMAASLLSPASFATRHSRGRPSPSCSTPATDGDATGRIPCRRTSPCGSVARSDHMLKRRDTLVQTFLALASCPLIPPSAFAVPELQEDVFRIYEDEVNKFSISVPREWSVGLGETNGIKSITAFYPEEKSDSNISVVITGIGPDFTRLESFGKVDEFAENLVSGLDRSWQRPPGVAAKLVDARAANGLYYVEYTLQNPGEQRRRILSAIGMASNGWYNRLYTVTGQFVDKDEGSTDKFKAEIERSVASFRLTP